ncbi:amyloid beta A4 precursor protein-binding family B member 1-interacting protein [Engraulis encrasicolus]|uniref:amyloid beta A4 precursor protein-binding family B member 1-interacting protein n=1 Tax=Engraulis encrasicolus TaxID=184585 RepID=UPI002FD68FF6
MDDIDAMFSDLLGEMDLLTQSLGVETLPPEPPPSTASKEMNFSTGFDFNASIHELEDNDLDALMADLVADINATEEKLIAESKEQRAGPSASSSTSSLSSASSASSFSGSTAPTPTSNSFAFPSPTSAPAFTPTPTSGPAPALAPAAGGPKASTSPPPPSQTAKPSMEEIEAQMKADKIKLALEKLKEAKVKKLVVKVEMSNGSAKTLMVDERQTVRDVLDNLFEKTHCDCNVDWCLYETNPDLQIERGFEDHENMVEPLSAWTRDSENRVLFKEWKNKYGVFKNPQYFYLWKKDKSTLKDMKEKEKELLLEENFCGSSIIVPDLEGVLHLKEDGKRSWKPRYFLLRASGMYFVPKGKTKTSRDLVCLVQFDNVNVYHAKDYKNKYKAPTDFCFILKHPQIQKESQYIKYLCCDDQKTMTLWVTGIRIAKYGMTLYDNYKTAVKKTSASMSWTDKIGSNASTPSPTPKAKAANGHAAKPAQDAAPKAPSNQATLPPPPPSVTEMLPPPPPDPSLPPPPTTTMFSQGHLPPPPPPSSMAAGFSKGPLPPPPPPSCMGAGFSPPPPPLDDLPPPPPPDDDEMPPDFLPPPPPAVGFPAGGLPPPPPDPVMLPPPPPSAFPAPSGGPVPPPPPPPPPPAAAAGPKPPVRKVGPPPPKRTTPVAAAPSGGGDFMNELMVAMQKKRNL